MFGEAPDSEKGYRRGSLRLICGLLFSQRESEHGRMMMLCLALSNWRKCYTMIIMFLIYSFDCPLYMPFSKQSQLPCLSGERLVHRIVLGPFLLSLAQSYMCPFPQHTIRGPPVSLARNLLQQPPHNAALDATGRLIFISMFAVRISEQA